MTAISSLPCPTAGAIKSAPARTVASASETPVNVPLCLERIRGGDEDAARLLIQHLYPLVIARSPHLPRRTSEEDLTQSVFMKMFNLGQYSGTVPLERGYHALP
jgi:hypothetical protein